MKIPAIILGYMAVALLALVAGFAQALLSPQGMLPPQETAGGVIALSMIGLALPAVAVALLYLAIRLWREEP